MYIPLLTRHDDRPGSAAVLSGVVHAGTGGKPLQRDEMDNTAALRDLTLEKSAYPGAATTESRPSPLGQQRLLRSIITRRSPEQDSSNATIGIVVGVLLAVFVLASLAFLWVYRNSIQFQSRRNRRRRRRARQRRKSRSSKSSADSGSSGSSSSSSAPPAAAPDPPAEGGGGEEGGDKGG